jgi:hypothetical protein
VGRGRGDCDAAHEILKTNMKTIIYQSYDIIASICQVYTWYISCINLVYDDVQAYTWHTPTQNFLGHFGTCHVTVWTWYIPSIYLVYTRYMVCPYRNVTGTKMSQKVLSRCMSTIYLTSSYTRFMHGIYQVYT